MKLFRGFKIKCQHSPFYSNFLYIHILYISLLVTMEEVERTFLNFLCVSGFQNAPFSGPVLCNIHLQAVYWNILNDLGICHYSVAVPSTSIMYVVY